MSGRSPENLIADRSTSSCAAAILQYGVIPDCATTGRWESALQGWTRSTNDISSIPAVARDPHAGAKPKRLRGAESAGGPGTGARLVRSALDRASLSGSGHLAYAGIGNAPTAVCRIGRASRRESSKHQRSLISPGPRPRAFTADADSRSIAVIDRWSEV